MPELERPPRVRHEMLPDAGEVSHMGRGYPKLPRRALGGRVIFEEKSHDLAEASP